MKNFLLKLFSIIFKLIIILIKILFCLFITFTVCYFAGIASVVASANRNEFDWQILLYVIVSGFMILGLWLLAFIKTKRNIKLIYAVIFFIWLFSPRILPSVMKQFDEDSCVDSGICAEGLKFGNDVMSKDYCIKKGKKWDDKRKECDMAIESRTCREQGYEWIIEKGKCSHKIIKNW